MTKNKCITLTFNDSRAKKYLQKEYNRRYPEQVFWTMRDGSLINIKDMTDEHLLRTIKLLERQEDYYEALGSYPDF